MSDTDASVTHLSADQALQMRQGAARLRQQFAGQLNAETIERFMTDSFDQLAQTARVSNWLPLLAERFAKERVRLTHGIQHNIVKVPAVPKLVHLLVAKTLVAGTDRYDLTVVGFYSSRENLAEHIGPAAVKYAEIGGAVGIIDFDLTLVQDAPPREP